MNPGIISGKSAPMSETSKYGPYRMSDEEFRIWIDRPSNVTKSIELCQGRLYSFGDDAGIARKTFALSQLLVETLPSHSWSVKALPGYVVCDHYNALRPDIIVSRGEFSTKPTNLALVVEYERSSGYKRSRFGRQMYLNAGVYAHWLIHPVDHWVEITLRTGESALYTLSGDIVNLVLDDVIMRSFELGDLTNG